MAQKAIIYKTELQIADMDRHRYRNYSLTVARHPSETNVRMMARLLSFALNASEELKFTKGISTDDEPDIWEKNLTDDILLWIVLGQPGEKHLRKACGRADEVIVYTYQQRSAELWWKQFKDSSQRFDNLKVFSINEEACKSLTQLVNRHIHLQCTVQDGECWITHGESTVHVILQQWK
ncbi:MAG: YaeQ family protein [Gammaproteobacteria bacterium]|nr:YaeQ family protein [Gammaproteobacteria bacterium]